MQQTTVTARDGAAEYIEALQRAEAEFREMPGLQVTEAQAACLWGADLDVCRAVLMTLVERRFLVHTRRDTFARVSESRA